MSKEQEMKQKFQSFKKRFQEIKKIPADLEYTQEQMKVRQKARSEKRALNLQKPLIFKKLYEKEKQQKQKEKDLQNAEKDTKNTIEHDEVNNIIKPHQNIKSKTQTKDIQQKKKVTECNPQPSIDINKQDINGINKRSNIYKELFKQKKKQQSIFTLDNRKVTEIGIKKETRTNMQIKNVRIENKTKSQGELPNMGKQLDQKKNDINPKNIFRASSFNNEKKTSFGQRIHKIGRSTMRVQQPQDTLAIPNNKVNPQSSIDNQNKNSFPDKQSEIKVESIKEEKKISNFFTSIRKPKIEEVPKKKDNFYIRAFASQDQNKIKRQIPQNSYNMFISQQQQKQNPQ